MDVLNLDFVWGFDRNHHDIVEAELSKSWPR